MEKLFKILSFAAILGDLLLILWLLYNGIDEGFKSTLAQAVSGIGAITLLALNILLLLKKDHRSKFNL